MTINWEIYDSGGESLDFVSGASGRSAGVSGRRSESDVPISEYNAFHFEYYNDSYAIYSVESFYVLYSSQSVNEYSTSICDIHNTNYFEPGIEYTFENSIEFTFSNNSSDNNSTFTAWQSDSVSFIANGGPINGSCNVSPQKGVSLQDEFNFSCNGWIDSDGSSDKLTYNFIYDGFLFLKTSYDETAGINTLLGNGNHTITAVILDEYLVPSCVDMNVIVSDESNNELVAAMSLPLNDFSNWLEILFLNLTMNATTSEVALITDIINDLLLEYLDNDESSLTVDSDDNEALADVQTNIINEYIDSVLSNNITSVAEVVTVLEVLSDITVPVIITTENGEDVDPSGVYNASFVENLLDIVANTLVELLQESVINGDLENVDADTAQNVFGKSCYVIYV